MGAPAQPMLTHRECIGLVAGFAGLRDAARLCTTYRALHMPSHGERSRWRLPVPQSTRPSSAEKEVTIQGAHKLATTPVYSITCRSSWAGKGEEGVRKMKRKERARGNRQRLSGHITPDNPHTGRGAEGGGERALLWSLTTYVYGKITRPPTQ